MKEKKDCKIIQDLLPNYIEELTNLETNNYIEEHIKKCNECNNVLENMKKDLKIDTEKRDEREVKYIKKYSTRVRVLKSIILLIIIIFVIVTARKMYLISNLSNKANESVLNTNYHRIIYSYSQGYYIKSEIFSLDNKKKMIITTMSDEESKTVTMYATRNGEEYGVERYLANIYTETKDSKTVELDKNIGISVDAQNTLYTENIFKLFLYSVPTSIKKTTFYGKECYYISNFSGPLSPMDVGTYIDKESGLMVGTMASEYEDVDGTIGRNPTSEYVYEFNVVTENDFIEPDINEYEIIEE